MAGSLLQSSSVTFEASIRRYGQIKEDKLRRIDRPMLWRVPATPRSNLSLKVRNFSRLRRTSTATGMVPIIKPGQSLLLHFSALPRLILNPSTISGGSMWGKRCLMVPKAFHKFDKFSEKAKRVLILAQEEANTLGDSCIGTEHILVGIIGEGSGIGYEVLNSMKLNLKDIRAEIVKVKGKGTKFGSSSDSEDMHYSYNAKKLLLHSLGEVKGQGKLLISFNMT